MDSAAARRNSSENRQISPQTILPQWARRDFKEAEACDESFISALSARHNTRPLPVARKKQDLSWEWTGICLSLPSRATWAVGREREVGGGVEVEGECTTCYVRPPVVSDVGCNYADDVCLVLFSSSCSLMRQISAKTCPSCAAKHSFCLFPVNLPDPDRLRSVGHKRTGSLLHAGLLPDRICLAKT